jgi:hypothetical protein
MQEEFKYFVSFCVHRQTGNNFYNTEIINKLIESQDDIKDIEKKLEITYFETKHITEYVSIINYRMF